ncbi:MAG: hypothetical protein JNK46_11610 [Methylobacteriaceae bacterium]|nr:hypothetical protein [Methylobacteriaceae bacterium]
MQALIWEQDGFWVFALVTLVMGGATAWATGRAIAQTWRPLAHVLTYMAPLAIAVRFLHYALFQGYFISWENFGPGLRYLVVTYVILAAVGVFGWRVQRAAQMARQYSWLATGKA